MATFTGTQRRDRMFAGIWLLFAVTSFVVDSQAACGVDFEARGTAFDAAIANYGRTVDPVFLARPDWALVMLLFSTFVFGPLKIVTAVALWKGITRLRPLVLVFAGAYAYSTALWIAVGLFGSLPSPAPVQYVMTNGPYLVVPLLFAWLARRER